eukprot:6207259-Pleurochrysis_carterae.AAC.1
MAFCVPLHASEAARFRWYPLRFPRHPSLLPLGIRPPSSSLPKQSAASYEERPPSFLVASYALCRCCPSSYSSCCCDAAKVSEMEQTLSKKLAAEQGADDFVDTVRASASASARARRVALLSQQRPRARGELTHELGEMRTPLHV